MADTTVAEALVSASKALAQAGELICTTFDKVKRLDTLDPIVLVVLSIVSKDVVHAGQGVDLIIPVVGGEVPDNSEHFKAGAASRDAV